MNLDVQTTGTDRIEVELAQMPTTVDRALVRAINRSTKSGNTVLVRHVAANLGLKQKDVRAAIKLREATMGRPEASLAASLKKIPLIKFGARGPRPSKGQGKGVTAKIGVGSKTYPHAFIATVRGASGESGQHEGVFERVTTLTRKSRGAWSKNLPIYELKGPSIGHVVRKEAPAAIARIHEVFQKNFDHEVGFAKGFVDDGD